MSQNLETSIKIKAGVDGLEKFEQLRKQLENAGIDTSHLSDEFNQLVQSFSKAQQQQGLIDSFRKLKTETNESKQKMEASQQATNDLARQWKLAEKEAKALATAITQQGTVTKEQKTQLKQAEAYARDLNQQFQASIRETKNLQQQYEGLNLKLHHVRKNMAEAGISTKNLTEQQKQLKQQAEQASQGLQMVIDKTQDMNKGSHAIANIGQKMSQLNQEMRNAGTASEHARSSIDKALSGISLLQNAMGAVGIGASAVEIAKTADAYAGLSARMKIALGEHANIEHAMQAVKQIALETTSNLEATGNLYARLSKIGQEMNISQQDVLQLTKTINQAISISGGSAESAEASITQFQQALASGVLRGDEFNSMMEQSPRLTQALADGLGVTTGALRKMANEGKLTTDVITKAMLGQADKINQEYSMMPTTIGDAIENLKTQWTFFIGELDKGHGASAKVVEALNYVSQNLTQIADNAMLAGRAFIAWKLGNIAYEFYQKSKAIQTANIAIQQETTAVIANTQAQLANAKATQQANIAQQATAVQSAKNAQAIQVATTTTSTGLLGLIGRLGHFGIAVSALGALIPTVLQPMGEAAGEMLAKTELAFKGEAEALEQLEWQQQLSQWRAESLAKQKAELAHASEQVRQKMLGLTDSSKQLITQYEALKQQGTETGEALKKAFEKVNLNSTQGINDYVTALNALQQQGKATANEIQAHLKEAMSGKDLIVFQTNAKSAFMGTAQEAQKMALITEQAINLAIERTGLSFDQLKGHGSQASRALVNDTQVIINGLDQLKMQGIDTATALNASFNKAIAGADTQQQLNAIQRQIEQVRNELGQTVSNGLFQQLEQQSFKIRQNLDQVTAGLNSVNEAFATFGLRSKEEATMLAENYKQAYDKLKNSGQATTEQLQRAFQQYAEVAIQANGGMVDSALASQGQMVGLSVKADETGKAIVNTMQNASQSVNQLSDTAYNATSSFQALGHSAEQASEKAQTALDKAKQAGQTSDNIGGKLGTTTRQYYNLEAITNELKNKGFDDAQAYAKAQQVFAQASQQMLTWAGNNSLLRNLAQNNISRHGVTAEAMQHAMKQAGEEAVRMKAEQLRQQQAQEQTNQQWQQLQSTLQQLQNNATPAVNVNDFSQALNQALNHAQAQGGQQVLQQLMQDMQRRPR